MVCGKTHFTSVYSFQLRRERFTEELESYQKQVEEFATFSDVADVNKYLKKAQALNSKSHWSFIMVEWIERLPLKR